MKTNQHPCLPCLTSLLLAGSFLSFPLFAKEEAFNSQWFLKACQHALTNTEESAETLFTSGYCYGYIEGLRHAGEVANHFVSRPELWGRQLWCVPKEESLEGVARTIVDELRISSESRETDYSISVMRSLKKRYPCQ